AEDGIRDLIVTGVQTCALPISSSPAGGGLAAGCPNDRRLWIDLKWATKRHANGNAVLLGRIDQKIGDDGEIVHKGIAEQAEHCRSEERRVGKECRSRWSG